MAQKISPQQMHAVSALPGPDRYKHFVKRVADFQEAWGLRADGGWALMGNDDGKQSMPLWPHHAYAELFASGEWAAYKPAPIPFEDLLTKWLPTMAAEGTVVAVFPVTPMKGIIVEPLQLKHDLAEERKQYE